MVKDSRKILFMCYGNVARSQMAQAFYNKYSDFKDATSAAADINAGHKYRHPASDIITVMLEEGIDVSSYIVKPVTKDLVHACDEIIVLCDLDDCPKYVLESGKVRHIPISDPYGISIAYTRSIRDEIKRMVLGLLHK